MRRNLYAGGQTCFVSGAASARGNGRSVALKLAEQGADVAGGDIKMSFEGHQI